MIDPAAVLEQMRACLVYPVEPTRWKDGRYHQAIASPKSVEWEVQVLLFGLVCTIQPELIVETGCHHGFTTRVLGQAAMICGGSVAACDTEIHYVSSASKRCAGLPVTVYPLNGAQLPQLTRADFALLDSSNESRIAELKRLKPGCIAVVHDSIEPNLARALEAVGRKIDFPTAKGLTLIQIEGSNP